MEWWLLAGALLIARLPASLMYPNPHLTRALIAAPGYALLVALGLAVVLPGRPTTDDRRPTTDDRRPTNDQRPTTTVPEPPTPNPQPLTPNPLRWVAHVLVALALLWQGGLRFGDYLREFPAVISTKYQ